MVNFFGASDHGLGELARDGTVSLLTAFGDSGWDQDEKQVLLGL